MHYLCKQLLHNQSTGLYVHGNAAVSDATSFEDSPAEVCIFHCNLMKQTDCEAFSGILEVYKPSA